MYMLKFVFGLILKIMVCLNWFYNVIRFFDYVKFNFFDLLEV